MKDLILSNRLWIRITRHILLFVSMVLLFGWVAWSRSDGARTFVNVLSMVATNAVFFFGYAYLSAYLLIPWLLFRKRFLLFALLFILAGLLLSWLKFAVSDYLFYSAISPEDVHGDSGFGVADIIVNTKDMTFIVALFSLVKFSRDNLLQQNNKLDSEEKRLEAEIMVLEHQLDPHVIFNNFNNLYSISINRPDLLITTIRKLKAVLEYLFLEPKDTKVSLRKELKMIENYIGLERLRFGERVKINYQVNGIIDGVMIAPLILYTFIENCFEHGAGMDINPAWINIVITVKQSKLIFVAENSLPDNLYNSNEEQFHGGLENSIRRLEMLYPNSHRLMIREMKDRHIVELQMTLL